ncbi:hypothetical protein N7447_009713 [Penicillium robsamsonii]|uniref:uncharacterized protein n=1 Tax=Penicillium robsamsonii TaxID=1792511 RepID=UPI002548646F|nr:uncharacterized protein N7447_009713 [Penicillium robsamsonii]KAJ5812690.1 hypothetical protein N7447_009713 [Penicillium robsamsonii]
MPNTALPAQETPSSNQQFADPNRDQSAEYSSDSDNDHVGLNGSTRALKRKRPLTVSCVPESPPATRVCLWNITPANPTKMRTMQATKIQMRPNTTELWLVYPKWPAM